mmetsp:Transcript_14474/g.31418  ORF Transcript_14474/g.31418 Transcript_14474/m.31418 type:complete len:111 (+) Transcript_14474:193-525(+)
MIIVEVEAMMEVGKVVEEVEMDTTFNKEEVEEGATGAVGQTTTSLKVVEEVSTTTITTIHGEEAGQGVGTLAVAVADTTTIGGEEDTGTTLIKGAKKERKKRCPTTSSQL